MGIPFEIVHKIEYFESDMSGKLSLPMILNLAVLSSKKQSDHLGVGQEEHLSRGLGWVILQYDVHIKRRPTVNEVIRIETQASQYNPFFVHRPFVFFDEQNEEIIRVDSIWAMLDIDNRRMARIPQDIIDKYSAERVKQINHIPRPDKITTTDDIIEKNYHVRYLDIDTNQHVNNSKYFEWMQDVLDLDYLKHHEITNINIKYENEVRLGQEVISQVAIADNVTKHRIMVAAHTSAEAIFTWRSV